jgi:hypothetical protein
MPNFNRPSARKRSPKTKRPWRVEHRRIDLDPNAKWSAFLPSGGPRTFSDRGTAMNACDEEAHNYQIEDQVYRNTSRAHRQWRVRNKVTGEIPIEINKPPKDI